MMAAIARGRTRIINTNRGLDVDATIRALRQLGVRISRDGSAWMVIGRQDLRDPARPLDCGNSGTTMRLLAGLMAGRVNAVLIGDESLSRRPMVRVVDPLNEMGARIRTSTAGRPPLVLRSSGAHLIGIRYTLPVASAQVKSALLFAGLNAAGPTMVTSPYRTRDHSERMLRVLGAKLIVRGKTVEVRPSSLKSPGRIRIPGDFSAAVYLLGAAATIPQHALSLRDVGINPTRTAALGVMRAMGMRISLSRRATWTGEPVADLMVTGGAPLRGVTVAAPLVPILIDEIPALCAIAATARGVFIVRGAAELKVKESNRIKTTVELLKRFGAAAKALPDGIEVRGPSRLRAPKRVNTRGDHRIGMAAAILAAASDSPITIEDSECIATSFPGFAATWRTAFAQAR
jgi:3-phosphoshikimate 1-carboxyvinyltransferase